MKKFLKILLYAGTVVLGIFTAAFLIGFLASPDYTGSKTETIAAPVDKVWKMLNDIEAIPKYREEVSKVEILSKDEQGKLHWKEYTDMDGYIVFKQTELIPSQKMTLIMIESSFGMKGQWTYLIKAKDNATEVTIEERSRIDNIFVRLAMVLSGRDSNLKKEFEIMNKYLAAEKVSTP